MKAFLWVVALAMSVAPASASDGFMSGTALLKSCEGGLNQQVSCEGYLQGVSDTLDYVGQSLPASKLSKSCVPLGTKPEVLRRIFVKIGHLGLHNEQPASSLAMVAFTAIWRCAPNAEYNDAYELLGKSLRSELKL
jgi:hypothetical protein